MLLEFSVENFKSIKSKQTVSFLAGLDKKHPANVVKFADCKALKTIGIWGPNASGKSNLIQALLAIRMLAIQSATGWNRNDQMPFICPFLLDESHAKCPSQFSLTIRMEQGDIYEYVIAATPAHVTFESLSIDRPRHKKTELFVRRRSDTGTYSWTFSDSLAPLGQQLEDRTRDNASALSHGMQMNVRSFAPLFDWLANMSVIGNADLQLKAAFSNWLSMDPHRIKRLAALLHDADLGIEGLEIRQRLVELPPPVRGMIDALRQTNPAMMVPGNSIVANEIVTKHRAFGSDRAVEFQMETQDSRGTSQLFAIGAAFLMAMELGGMLAIDEIDCSMHPKVVRALLALFQNEKANARNAQLLFTTHDVTLMNQHLLRRDQIWLVDKCGDGSSSLCSLFDFENPEGKPRSTERFAKNYMAGRYGAVPHLGAILEDFDPQWFQTGAEAGNKADGK
jgi:uncharacterized protein